MRVPTLIATIAARIPRTTRQPRLMCLPCPRARGPILARAGDVVATRGPPSVDDLVEVAGERVEVVQMEKVGRLTARQRVAQGQPVGAPETDQPRPEAQAQRQLELASLLGLGGRPLQRARVVESRGVAPGAPRRGNLPSRLRATRTATAAATPTTSAQRIAQTTAAPAGHDAPEAMDEPMNGELAAEPGEHP